MSTRSFSKIEYEPDDRTMRCRVVPEITRLPGGASFVIDCQRLVLQVKFDRQANFVAKPDDTGSGVIRPDPANVTL